MCDGSDLCTIRSLSLMFLVEIIISWHMCPRNVDIFV